VVPRENAGVLDKEELKLVKETQEKHKHCLRIPRRYVICIIVKQYVLDSLNLIVNLLSLLYSY
jgi:hypothetical protein